mgnify:FL=1
MLTYELKAAVILVVFFALYALLMRRDTHFHLRRMALLASLILSAVLPLCHIEWHVEEIISPDAAGNLPSVLDDAAGQPDTVSIWAHYATIAGMVLLFLGMAVMAVRSIKELVSLQRIIRRHRSHKTSDGATIVVSNSPTRPFSYLNYIVMSEADFERNHDALIMHEQAHIRHHHTIDLFLMNLLLTLQWFNPVAWKLRKELTMVHEYEADEDVLNAGINSTDYIQLLISKATGRGRFSLANTLSEKRMLRQRVEMLARKRTTKWAKLKTLSLLPVIALSLGMSAKVVKDYTYLEQPTALQSQNGQEKNKRTQQKDRQTAPAGKAGEHTADNTKKTHTADDDSVEYKVNGIQLAKPDVDNINPDKIKQVTIIKSPTSNNDNSTDKPLKHRVYVDINDTIIKKVDDNTYIMFDSQEDYDEFRQQSDDISIEVERARSEAEAAQQEARKKAGEARSNVNEARAKRHRDAERVQEHAEKMREGALIEADKARKYKDQAHQLKTQMKKDREAIEQQAKEARIASETAKRKAQVEAMEARKKAITERERARRMKDIKEKSQKQYDSTLHSFNHQTPDSTFMLTVEGDGTITNITAYQTDTTSNETNLMLICKKEGQDLIVIYKRI